MRKKKTIKQTRNFDLRPASVEEAGLFYTAENQDAELGTVGHLRMILIRREGFLPHLVAPQRRPLQHSGV